MKIPLSWLRDFVDLDGVSIEDLAHTLTMAGLEVEEILEKAVELGDLSHDGIKRAMEEIF